MCSPCELVSVNTAVIVVVPGVGGIEAEAVMLGQAISMVLPKVVGYKLTGEVGTLATSTDVVLTITKVQLVCIVMMCSLCQNGARAIESTCTERRLSWSSL